MSESINPNINKTSFASDLKNTLAFSALFPAGGAVKSTIKNKGIANAVSSLELEKFKKLQTTLKTNNADVFTRNIKLSESYGIYKGVSTKAKSLSNKLARAEKRGGISLFQKFKNLFLKDKVTLDTLKESSEQAAKELKKATDALDNGQMLAKTKKAIKDGKTIIKNADGVISSVAAKEAAEITAGKTVKNLFKSELKNKFVLGITILGAIPRIKEEVIPTFKEKGFIEGIKATGKVIARTGIDFVSNAGFSAIGRAIGTAAGSILPGIGNAIGGMLGDAVGTCISMRFTSKIFDKNKNTANSANTQNNQTKDMPQKAPVANQEELTGDKNLDKKINLALSI